MNQACIQHEDHEKTLDILLAFCTVETQEFILVLYVFFLYNNATSHILF